MYKLVIFDVSGTLDDGAGHLYDGIKTLLQDLHTSGVMIALATQLGRSGLNDFIARENLQDILTASVCAGEANYKPDPEMIDLLLIETGVEATSAIMVGDSSGDILMAKAAKISSCAVSWDGNWYADVLQCEPDFRIEDLESLRSMLLTA